MNAFFATLCVILFSMTVPATRIAALSMPPELIVGFRLAGAGLICLAVVLFLDRWVPPRRIWLPLLATSVGSVSGFSFLISLAMRTAPGTHGAIALAALPAATAAYASLRDGVNPGPRFWIYCVFGTLASIGFFLAGAQGGFQAGDLPLMASVFAGAFGYVEGGRLSREFGGRRVMSWAILLAMPLATAILLTSHADFPRAPIVWSALAYLAIVSQSLGMFLWYRVLARGPMVKIAMIQLLQPFFTLMGAVLLLGESAAPSTWAIAALVAVTVFAANKEKALRLKPA
jgi:drug/metabolite transporter (DMT)-like permease